MKSVYISPALTLIFALIFAATPSVAPQFSGAQNWDLPVQIARHAVQPSPYAFAIWGVIFLWLIAMAVFGLIKRADAPQWRPARPMMITAAILGTAWLILVNQWPLVAGALILGMAVAAIAGFWRTPSVPDRWILSAPLAMFAGWLTAACLVSTGILLGGYGILAHETAALIIVVILLGVAIFIQSRRPQMPIYGLTVVWAMVAVVHANMDTNPGIAAAAGIAATIMLAATVVLRIESLGR